MTEVIQSTNKGSAGGRLAVIGLIAVVVGVGGFVGGMQFQKGQATGTVANANAFTPGGQQAAAAGGGQMQMNGSMGTVTAISSSSISVNDARANTTKTYSISSTTTVTDNGTTANTSDIVVGDTVMIQTSSSTSVVATSIVLNPSMGPQPTTQTSST